MPSLSNSYQPLSVRAGSTCFTFVYVNVIDLFWSLSSVRCVAFSQFSPDCLRFISPGGFGSGDHSQAFLPYSLPAWHCATLIKTAHHPPNRNVNNLFLCFLNERVCLSVCSCACLMSVGHIRPFCNDEDDNQCYSLSWIWINVNVIRKLQFIFV